MSSHHFVKEGQEPALFIAEASSFASIAPLLEWAPLVMVLGTALDSVLSWGVKIDVVLIGPGNDIEKLKETIQEQMPVTVLTYNEDQDPMLFGLTELVKNQNAVNIVQHASSDTFKKVLSFTKQINIVLLDNDMRWLPIFGIFQKWLPAKSIVALKTNAHQSIKHTGLTQRGIDLFETIADGNITIESSDVFWVGETIV
jgi:hypothetical protein